MILDEVWVLLLLKEKAILCDEQDRMFFGRNPTSLWAKIEQYTKEFYSSKGECLGIGMTNAELHKEGYRARKVQIRFL